MRLNSFRIQNFKSIIDSGECYFNYEDNILVLAGQNEAGKSAILEGLQFFYKGPSRDFEMLQKRSNDELPYVCCNFKLEKKDVDSLKESKCNRNLVNYLKENPDIKIERTKNDDEQYELFLTDNSIKTFESYFSEEQNKTQNEILELEDEIKELTNEIKEKKDEIDQLQGQINNTGNPQQKQILQKQQNTKVNEKTKLEEKLTEYNGKIEELKNTLNYEDVTMSFDDFKQFLIGKIRMFTLFNSFEDLLPGEVKISEIDNYPAIKDFENVFSVDFQEIANLSKREIQIKEKNINKEASDDFNKYWNQQLDQNHFYNFNVKISKPSGEEDVEERSTLEFTVDRNDSLPLYLEQKSAGFRWFSAFNLRLRALNTEEIEDENGNINQESDFLQNLVLLIDEPGQGLHEKAQNDVKKVLNDISSKGAQIIYSTHHPNLIGTRGKELIRNRLITNYKNDGTKIWTLSQFSASPHTGAQETLSPIVSAMGLDTVTPFFSHNSKNIIVEGISDHYYLNSFAKLLNYDEDFAFIPACGVNNVPNIISILLGWGLDWLAIIDDDPNQGRKVYKELKSQFFENSDEAAQQKIKKIKKHGIEDIFYKSDFNKYVLKNENADTKKENSEMAKGQKELLARLFLDEVSKNKENIKLTNTTINNMKNILDWIV